MTPTIAPRRCAFCGGLRYVVKDGAMCEDVRVCYPTNLAPESKKG